MLSRRKPMRSMMWIGIVLVLLGVAGLVIQNVKFTETKKVLDVGPLQVNAEEQHSLPIPTIAGVVAVLAGLTLVFVSQRRA
jgi:hypothetical protein